MTRRQRTQIILVSEQAAPNLLAALDPAIKPAEVVLMVSSKMEPRAKALEAVLKEAGIRTSPVSLDNEHDFAALQNALLEVAGARAAEDITLNVTGGTKLMALAAQSVARLAEWPIIYVDADTDEVIWLGNDVRRQPLSQQLRLSHYLRSYGFTLAEGVTRPQPSRRHNELLQTLVTQVGSLEQPLGQLNWLAQQAENSNTLDVPLSAQASGPGLDALLRIFEDAGALKITRDRLLFTSPAERDFIKGGWLEQHVYRTVESLVGELGIRDKAANLAVTDASGVKNELDVVFMARNRLFIIECKTARMDRPEAPKANDTLFKLAEIRRRVGGLGARGMLTSYRRLRESEKKLARALNIEFVCGAELARLDEKLKAWVRK